VAFEIAIAETEDAILATYDMMGQLHPNVQQMEKLDYVRLIRQQQREFGFQLAILKEDDRVNCAAGFRFCRSIAWGKFLYVDDLVTEETCRSRGLGKAMLRWLVETARDAQCDELRLDAATYRHGAQRFYLRERMDIACFHFRLVIEETEPGGHLPA
jgi:GNAT superfamily N-acetyltransferase